MAMGSNLSCILSDLVLEKLFDTVYPELPYRPQVVYKYVDDILTFLPLEHVQETLNKINSYHQKLQFTVETENEQQLNYLDMTLIRQNDKIVTNWYSKSTSSGRILHYFSAHPHHMKYNIAFEFSKKVIFLSNQNFHQSNITKIHDILTQNGYPEKLIRNVIHRSLRIFNGKLNPRNNLAPPAFEFIDIDTPQNNVHLDHENQSRGDSHPNTNSTQSNNNYVKQVFTGVSYVPHLTENMVRDRECGI
jgi:hypothetical protein